MKSNVCKIYSGTKDLEAIFRESEKVAVYNDLTPKQTLQLRLICEEIDGMLPNVIEDFAGDLWFECEDGVCKVNVSIKIPDLSLSKKEELIGIAKSKKNAAAVGISGKIRNAVEDFLLDEVAMNTLVIIPESYHMSAGFGVDTNYAHVWSLVDYRSTVKEEKSEAWDELEKSVIASVADDVIVGVKGKQADIIIIKKFA